MIKDFDGSIRLQAIAAHGVLFSDMPFEVMSEIFMHFLLGCASIDDKPSKARKLLRLSHICAYFRHVILNDPSLWADLPYLNGVHEDFLEAIMVRSYPSLFSLSCTEDDTLTDRTKVWQTMDEHAWRISGLRICVSEGFDGDLVEYFLGIPAPHLKECSIDFRGDRNVNLDALIPPHLFNHPPPLQTLRLINCHISPNALPLAGLRDVRLVSREGATDRSECRLPASQLATRRLQFDSLHTLHLINSIQSAETLVSADCLDLRSLQRFVLEASTDVCVQMRLLCLLPRRCSRTITFTFPPDEDDQDPARVAKVAVLFVPEVYQFSDCSIGLEDPSQRPCVTLTWPGAHPTAVTLRFNLFQLEGRNMGRGLTQYIAGLNPLLAICAGRYPPERFLRRLWSQLIESLGPHLAHVTTLALSLDSKSNAPLHLVQTIQAMPNLRVVLTDGPTPGTWLNQWTRQILRPVNAPRLEGLVVPFDVDAQGEVVGAIRQLLLSWEASLEVTFRVPAHYASTFGYAASEEICTRIGELTHSFPATARLKWVWGCFLRSE